MQSFNPWSFYVLATVLYEIYIYIYNLGGEDGKGKNKIPVIEIKNKICFISLKVTKSYISKMREFSISNLIYF